MTFLNLVKNLDLKTWLIIILCIMVAAITVLNRPVPNPLKSELSNLKKQHRKEMRDIEKQNEMLDERIQDYVDIIEENQTKLANKDREIASLERAHDLTRKERDRLKKELVEFEEEFKEMSNEEFVDWLREFFKSKGIKE